MLGSGTEDLNTLTFVDFLVLNGALKEEEKGRFLSAYNQSNQPVDVILTELGLLQDQTLARHLARFFDCSYCEQDELAADLALAERLGNSFLSKSVALPLISKSNETALAVADPFDQTARTSVEFIIEETVPLVIMTRSGIIARLKKLAEASEIENPAQERIATQDATHEDLDRLQDVASEAPVVRFVAQTIQTAVERRATDIHIEPVGGKLVVRCRVDGMLTKLAEEPISMHQGVVTRIKVLSRLNIAERRRPQDGQMRITARGKNIDLRVSVVPTIDGEAAVLRILDKSAVPLELASLGFDKPARDELRRLMRSPNGMILATGPTGSGKTTTLYSLLQEIIRPDIKVFTIEDPVEYKLEGAVQLQVNPDIDFTFANALRSVLRQDPDVILIGEIRDRETAEIAIRAALTGHLVLSTLHTNSAVDAITRLRDMGLESYLLAATIRGVLAQRLLRKICSACSGQSEAETCGTCGGTGYFGRTVCHEILPFTEDVCTALAAEKSSAQIAGLASENNMIPLMEKAQLLVASKLTTEQEVQRVIALQGG